MLLSICGVASILLALALRCTCATSFTRATLQLSNDLTCDSPFLTHRSPEQQAISAPPPSKPEALSPRPQAAPPAHSPAPRPASVSPAPEDDEDEGNPFDPSMYVACKNEPVFVARCIGRKDRTLSLSKSKNSAIMTKAIVDAAWLQIFVFIRGSVYMMPACQADYGNVVIIPQCVPVSKQRSARMDLQRVRQAHRCGAEQPPAYPGRIGVRIKPFPACHHGPRRRARGMALRTLAAKRGPV
jgi:hypothetical protein